MLFTFQTHFEALGRQFKNEIQVRHFCNRMYVADKNDGLFLASAVHESHSKRITSLSLCYSKPHFLYKKYSGVSVKTVCVPCMHVWYKNKSLRLKKKAVQSRSVMLFITLIILILIFNFFFFSDVQSIRDKILCFKASFFPHSYKRIAELKSINIYFNFFTVLISLLQAHNLFLNFKYLNSLSCNSVVYE